MACADEKTCLAVCQNKVGCSNIAYPKLVMELLPLGKCKYKTFYYLKMDLSIIGFWVHLYEAILVNYINKKSWKLTGLPL